MKCPLSEIARYWDGKETQAILSDCLKEECAWWLEDEHRCAVKALGEDMTAIIVISERIANGLRQGEIK